MPATHEEVGPPEQAQYRVIIYRDSSVRTFVLDGERWVVGRSEEADIRLHDPTASRHHMVLERREGAIWMRDLGGVNSTLLNGRPVHEARLAVGATLTVGMTRLTLDTVRPRTKVKIEPVQGTRALQQRSYMEQVEQSRVPDLVHPVRLPTNANLQDLVRHTLHTLATPLSDLGSEEELASVLLDFALEHTSRRRGLVGTFDGMGRLSVLASSNREQQGGELLIPADLVQDARVRRAPFLTNAIENGKPGLERLFVPFGDEPAGLLILEAPAEHAPRGQEALRLASALAQLIWMRLVEIRERKRLRDELQGLRLQRNPMHAALFASARLHGLCKQLRAAARHAVPIHLVGEEGTEKETLARYVHGQSDQAAGPFVSFHCGVIPPERFEEELLGPSNAPAVGHSVGGALVRAQGGTLYLERPELLTEQVQERLAALLSPGFTPALEGSQSLPLGVRLISASTGPLSGASAPSRLRQSLAEVLLGCSFEIPPLRTHPSEIAALAELILSEMGPSVDGAPRSLSDGARKLLVEHPWPGNLRQLRRVLEFAAARAGNHPIAPRHLAAEVQVGTQGKEALFPSLADVEKQHILRVLQSLGGNKRETAAQLGIAPSTLYEKLKRFDLAT